MPELEKPDLYALADDGRRLQLIMGHCTQCAKHHFPKTGYGCPNCGAVPEHVRSELGDGRATLLTFITLHAKLVPTLEVPCIVGEAQIADGMIEEVMLLGAAEQYRDGMALRAVAHEVTRGGRSVLACRFAPAED